MEPHGQIQRPCNVAYDETTRTFELVLNYSNSRGNTNSARGKLGIKRPLVGLASNLGTVLQGRVMTSKRSAEAEDVRHRLLQIVLLP